MMNDATLRFLVNLQPKQSGTHELPKPKYTFGGIDFQVEWLFSDSANQGQLPPEWYSLGSDDWNIGWSHWSA